MNAVALFGQPHVGLWPKFFVISQFIILCPDLNVWFAVSVYPVDLVVAV